MRQLIYASFLALAVALLAGGSPHASPKIKKQHDGLSGKDGAKVSCPYCHGKAKLKKKKGSDIAATKKGPYCAMDGCH